MVSNIKRIHDEIREGARQIAREYDLDPDAVVDLIMQIVDLEDDNRIKVVPSINKKVKGMIENAVQVGDSS